MDQNLLQLGLGAVIAIMILREVLPYFRDNRNRKRGQGNGSVEQVDPRDSVSCQEFDNFASKVQLKEVCAAELRNIHGHFDAIELLEVERAEHAKEQFRLLREDIKELKLLLSGHKGLV